MVYTIYVTFFCFYLEALKPEKSRANNVLVKMGLKGRVQNFAATPTQRVQRPKEVKGFSLGGGGNLSISEKRKNFPIECATFCKRRDSSFLLHGHVVRGSGLHALVADFEMLK